MRPRCRQGKEGLTLLCCFATLTDIFKMRNIARAHNANDGPMPASPIKRKPASKAGEDGESPSPKRAKTETSVKKDVKDEKADFEI